AGLSVIRPRFFQPPKVGGYIQSEAMLGAIRRAFRKLDGFKPDLIDAHFIYPDGVAAAAFAKQLGLPFMVTCRGEDILRFPSLRILGPKIRGALAQADRVVALSDEIANAAIQNHADPKRVVTIPNGVNTEQFRPDESSTVRSELGIEPDAKLIVSVGNLQERKGFHLLVDAMPTILAKHPDTHLIIVGGAARSGTNYGGVIREHISKHQLTDRVHLVGAVAHENLFRYYSASDCFALMTSREGSPNVLLEALACGVPAVATAIGGIPEVLRDERLGLLLSERTAADAATGILQAFAKTWDRPLIREIMLDRDWRRVATRVQSVFTELASDRLEAKKTAG
ncbi:MAG: glycosyltransferase, partial [Planctomycetota bacterium]